MRYSSYALSSESVGMGKAYRHGRDLIICLMWLVGWVTVGLGSKQYLPTVFVGNISYYTESEKIETLIEDLRNSSYIQPNSINNWHSAYLDWLKTERAGQIAKYYLKIVLPGKQCSPQKFIVTVVISPRFVSRFGIIIKPVVGQCKLSKTCMHLAASQSAFTPLWVNMVNFQKHIRVYQLLGNVYNVLVVIAQIPAVCT